MEVIAQAADLSRPALYQYFRNKEEVFRAAGSWSLEIIANRAAAEAAESGDTAERLAAVLDLVLRLYDAPGGRGGAFHAELIDEMRSRAADVWAGFEQRLAAALRSVLERSGEDVAGVPAADAALILLLGTKGIALHSPDPAEAARRTRQLIALAVRPPDVAST